MKKINSKGSTFVTAIVTIAIFMIIAGSIVTRIESSLKASNFNSAKINELAEMTNLKLHMATLATCQKNLKDKSLSSSGELVLPSILDGSGNALFTSGQKIAQAGLIVSDIRLRFPAGDPASVTGTSPAPAKGYALPTRIEVSFQKEKISFGSKTYTATLDVPILVDASAKILDCDSAATAFDVSGLCAQLGGTLDAGTKICTYPTDCSQKDATKLASGKCLNDGLTSLKTTITELQTALAPSPTPTATPEKVTPAQQEAWSKVEADVNTCVENGATVSEGKINCRVNYTRFAELTPTSSTVGKDTYTDPAVAAYLYKKAYDLVLAKFGYD